MTVKFVREVYSALDKTINKFDEVFIDGYNTTIPRRNLKINIIS